MFASIFGKVFPKFNQSEGQPSVTQSLINLAFTFSPLVEQTTVDTVVFDIEGEETLFRPSANSQTGSGWLYNLADQVVQCAERDRLKINVAIAATPDTAIHAARAIDGVTVIAPGAEQTRLGNLSLKLLDYALAGVDPVRATEIRETFGLWGLRTFGDFAHLPMKGIAQRLGQEGVRLQKLVQGRSVRHLKLVQPPIGFEQSLELEHPIEELEPLSFILCRLLNQLCANLDAHAFATNELRVRLKLEDQTVHERTLTLPVPMRNSKTFLRLCLLDLESHPPQAAVIAIAIEAEPTPPRVLQNGLFNPLAPEPEKLELTLARLAKLVGKENIGSPELLDTHRPDAFRMKRFALRFERRKSKQKQSVAFQQCVVGFRRFRPPLPAQVTIIGEHPTRISARKAASSDIVRGIISQACGPWRISGDWWRSDVWARDEWDVAVVEGNNHSEILCRIFRDLITDEWFVEGIYD